MVTPAVPPRDDRADQLAEGIGRAPLDAAEARLRRLDAQRIDAMVLDGNDVGQELDGGRIPATGGMEALGQGDEERDVFRGPSTIGWTTRKRALTRRPCHDRVAPRPAADPPTGRCSAPDDPPDRTPACP
jgi:hypothetical protein